MTVPTCNPGPGPVAVAGRPVNAPINVRTAAVRALARIVHHVEVLHEGTEMVAALAAVIAPDVAESECLPLLRDLWAALDVLATANEALRHEQAGIAATDPVDLPFVAWAVATGEARSLTAVLLGRELVGVE